MGDQCRRSDSGDTESDHRGDHSSPHPYHGLVQSQASKGMEVGIFANSEKLNDGLSPLNKPGLGKNDRPMVEVPFGHTETRKSENIGLESHPSNIGDTSVVRNDNGGEFDCEKNVGESSHFNGIHGQSVCYKAPASLPTHYGVQHSLNSHRKNDGCAGALCDSDAW